MEKKKGLSPIVIGGVVVVVLLAVGGYMLLGQKGKGGILPKVQLPGAIGLNANCELKDPELCRYVDKATKMMATFETGFSGRSVTTDKSGKKTESLWEMQGENSHFQSSENGKEVSNMIVIGDTTYTKDQTDGKWMKFTVKKDQSSSSGGLFNTDEFKSSIEDTIKEMKDQTSYKAMGKEKCGDLMCFKYEIVIQEMAGIQEFLYFDDREYLMRMMRTVDKEGNTTDTYFEYKAVSITAPSPVKEGEGFNLYDSSVLDKTGGTSSVDMEKLQKQAEELMKNVEVPEETPSGE